MTGVVSHADLSGQFNNFHSTNTGIRDPPTDMKCSIIMFNLTLRGT
jgi:hypothetical protein